MTESSGFVLDYEPDGATLGAFLRSDAFVRGIMGPWGSGKSACCCVEIFRRMCEQAPGPDGVRRTRWAVVRNTTPQLRMTTIKTWLQWFPERIFGPMKWSAPLMHKVSLKGLPDGSRIEAEVYFIPLDDEAAVNTLYSLELTGAWVNEARFVPKEAIDALTGRVRRYPSKREGGITWSGVIMDTNAPNEEHWWPIMKGDRPVPEHYSDADRLTLVKPWNWEFFTQPAGMVELFDAHNVLTGYELNVGQKAGLARAENLTNLEAGYYENLIQGKPRSWIEVNILNRYGGSFDGKPVYPSFRREAHVASAPLPYLPGLPVWVGIDFGRTPSAVCGQVRQLDWFIQYELTTADMAAKTFAGVLMRFLHDRYPAEAFEDGRDDYGSRAMGAFRFYGDPSGDNRGQTDDTTPLTILRSAGIMVHAAPTNDLVMRVDTIENLLNRGIEGKTSFQISPHCRVLIAACEGGYHYRKMQVREQEMYSPEPVKNRYSHPAEALQYMALGAGEGRELLGRKRRDDARMQRSDMAGYSVFDRAKRREAQQGFGARRFGGRFH